MKASSQMSIFVTFGKTINRWHLVVAQVSPSCYLPHEKTISTFFFASFHTSLDHHRNYLSLARWPPSPLVNLYRHMNPIMLKVLNSIKKLPPSPSKVSSANTGHLILHLKNRSPREWCSVPKSKHHDFCPNKQQFPLILQTRAALSTRSQKVSLVPEFSPKYLILTTNCSLRKTN